MNGPALDWRAIVEEAVGRRKRESLTQRDLAALAGVSPPTVVGFERGDTRLRMDKVFTILSALGMLAETGSASSQKSFVHAAYRRWNELIAPLEEDDPARLPFGRVTYDYDLGRNATPVSLKDLLPLLREAGQGETGWPPFWVATRDRIRPYTRDGVIECWQGVPEPDRSKDPSQADFWRVSPTGQAYLSRGLDEDGILSPGSILDVALPVWRTAEVLMHAERLIDRWPGKVDRIAFSLRYAGLAGRELASWAKPNRRYLPPGQWRSRVDDVTSTQTFDVVRLRDDLSHVLSALLGPVYARFDGYVAPEELIVEELAELIEVGRRKHRGRR